MSRRFTLRPFILAAAALLAGACATPQPYDYTAFKEARPKSLLVLPPLNNSPDVNASYSFLSHVTLPLAESGYYVLPVTLVDETKPADRAFAPALKEMPAPESRIEDFIARQSRNMQGIGQTDQAHIPIASGLAHE